MFLFSVQVCEDSINLCKQVRLLGPHACVSKSIHEHACPCMYMSRTQTFAKSLSRLCQAKRTLPVACMATAQKHSCHSKHIIPPAAGFTKET